MLQINQQTSAKEILKTIKTLREKKGREDEVLDLISGAIGYSHDLTISLFWEKALTYQHMFMNNNSNRRALGLMEGCMLDAEFYINRFKLIKWKSRLFRFLGRIADYKGKYSEACKYYRASLNLVKKDPEPFRILEIEGFLATSLIMAGKVDEGFKLTKKVFDGFNIKKVGKKLRKNDYKTWTIWKSGLIVRVVESLIKNKQVFDHKLISDWIKDVEKDLKKGDFSYRSVELTQLKQKLSDCTD